MKALFLRYKEIILYVFFGGLTTLVNWGTYWLLADAVKMHYLWATIIAQVVSILFAYITNRTWVFESKVRDPKGVFLEMLRFFSCRGVSILLDFALMWVGVALFKINDKWMKLIANVVVVLANYIFSKVFVFRNSSKNGAGIDESDKKEV